MVTRIADRWNNSVVFKLSAATVAISLFVMLLQATVGVQIFRLGKVQSSVNETSVPQLLETQQFARLTTRVVSETAQLENDLTKEELFQLREDYRERLQQVDDVLSRIASANLDGFVTTDFQGIRRNFNRINEELFSNQLEQRRQEEKISLEQKALLIGLHDLKEQIDLLLVRAMKTVLDQPNQVSDDQASVDDLMVFASRIKTLTSLQSQVLDIINMIENFTIGQSVDLLANNLKFRIRNIGRSLVLLEVSKERTALAKLTSETSRLLSAERGLIGQIEVNAVTRDRFKELKKAQVAAVEEIDRRTDQIVAAGNETFEKQIVLAASLTEAIMWIGIAATGFILACIFFVNRNLIQKQISQRFTLLTDDVVTISRGNYDHIIRVGGDDEIGTIARALDVFKGQAAEIHRSNTELEKFAYVAAHDLRSPLVAIQDLARWTLEDEREHLSPTCIENLELLIKRSERLSTLQTDLLTYAKVADIDTSEEDLNPLHEIQQISDLVDPNSNFNIRLLNDPGAITTFGHPFRQILLNLITNSIKHHDRNKGQISVRYDREPSRHIFTVEDDGPGIEPRYQGQIFELFKTLQPRDKVEGSGLGLALVSKLVQRLGGTVAVQSNAPEQRGCKFTFEIADLKSMRKSVRTAA